LAWRDDSTFVTVGVKHYKLWTFDKTLTAKRGIWAGQADRNLACVAFHGGNTFTGTGKGMLLKWKGNHAVNQKTSGKHILHPGGLDAISVYGDFLLTGGKDKKVLVINPENLEPVMEIDVSSAGFGSISPEVRALDTSPDDGRLIIGTFGSEIYELSLNVAGAKTGHPNQLVSGHFSPKMRDTNEVWGLCNMPTSGNEGDRYVTVSDDGTLRVWSATTRQQVVLINLNVHKDGAPLPLDKTTKEISPAAQARCVDVSADGSLCAVGFRSGQFRVYKTAGWRFQKAQKSPMKDWIEDLKFSPDGSMLAVSCHDNNVYVFSTRTLELHQTLSGSSSYVQHIDWCVNSRFLRTNDGSHELLHYNAKTGGQIVHQPRMKNAGRRPEDRDCTEYAESEWHTATCTLTWATQGIWSHGMDGSDINHCDRSIEPHPDGYKLLASGDDFGQVKIFRYPSMNLASEAVVCRGHSSHVTKVKFTNSGYLVSTGGNDAAVIQWKLDV